MKVALTGATGHLGGAIVRELYKRNYTVRALVRTVSRDWFDGIPVELVKGDLDDQHALKDLMDSCDALIHSAALISIHGDQHGAVQRTNIDGVKNVMETARTAGIKRVIHISSIHAYRQRPKFEILDEHREKVNSNSFAYDLSKKEGQELALSYSSSTMEVIVMNPTSLMGPYDYKPSKLGKAIIDMYRGKIPYLLRGGFDFCDTRDVAMAIVNSLTMGRNGESYLLSGKWYSIKEIATIISTISKKKNKAMILPAYLGWIGLPFIELLGWLNKSEPLYTNEALVAITDGNRNISSIKAQKELNLSPRAIEETLRDTCAWFLKNGYLG